MNLVRLLAFALVSLVSLLAGCYREAPPQPAVLRSEFIYETAPFPSCHASTIVEPTPGHLVAAWFGGTKERDPDVGIWVSRNDGAGWNAPVEVANGVQPGAERVPTWNPVLFQPRTGPLMLFYKMGPKPSQWWGLVISSTDGGKTWGTPRRLPAGIFGPIKNKPVQLADGTLLAPTSYESPDTANRWRIYFERSTDLGQTWTRTKLLNDGVKISAIQPSILFLGGDKLEAVGRTKQGKVFSISSNDLGQTWGEMTLTSLPAPNSGVDAVTLADGRHLLVYNHTSEPKTRTPLNVAVSNDGLDWKSVVTLEVSSGEYSYPAIIQTSDGLVHITYTWQRKKIRHVVLDPKKL